METLKKDIPAGDLANIAAKIAHIYPSPLYIEYHGLTDNEYGYRFITADEQRVLFVLKRIEIDEEIRLSDIQNHLSGFNDDFHCSTINIVLCLYDRADGLVSVNVIFGHF